MIQKYQNKDLQEKPNDQEKQGKQSPQQYKRIGIFTNILPGRGNQFYHIRISDNNRLMILNQYHYGVNEAKLFKLGTDDLSLTEIPSTEIIDNFNEVLFLKNDKFFILDFYLSLELYEILKNDTCNKVQVIYSRKSHRCHAKPCLSQDENFLYTTLDKEFQIFKKHPKKNTWKLYQVIQLPKRVSQLCLNNSDKQIFLKGKKQIFIVYKMRNEKWYLKNKIILPSIIFDDLIGFQGHDQLILKDNIIQWNQWQCKFIRKSKLLFPQNVKSFSFSDYSIKKKYALLVRKKRICILKLINNVFVQQQMIQLNSKTGSEAFTKDGQFLFLVILSKMYVFQLEEGK